MGWMAPFRHRRANLVFLANHQEREPSMSEITIIGLDWHSTAVPSVTKCVRFEGRPAVPSHCRDFSV
jgi:hypothetical protein